MGLFRFYLALCVVMAHIAPNYPIINLHFMNETTAVEVFFIISGFYMQMILSDKYTFEKIGSKYILKFYLSRYTRLFPAYEVCLLFTLIYIYFINSNFDYHEFLNSPKIIAANIINLSDSFSNIIFKLYYFITNIFIFFQDLVLNITVINGAAGFSFNRGQGDFCCSGSFYTAGMVSWLGIKFLSAGPIFIKS